MRLFKISYFVVPLMLLLVVNTMAVIYDDDGKVITEEETKNEIYQLEIQRYHSILADCIMYGGGTVGCVTLSIGILYFGASIMPTPGNPNSEVIDRWRTKSLFLTVVGVGVIFFSQAYGRDLNKYLEKEEAIKRIKERRRNQKQNEGKESFVPESKITLLLLTGRF